MRRTEVVVVGGGQAGLSMSRVLTERGVDHVVLERGRIGQRWRAERWDSLRLLTPRWQTRLPGHRPAGPDLAGFMSKWEVVDLLERYARSFRAPVLQGVTVQAASRDDDGFLVETDAGAWRAGAVVIATGHCHEPRVPEWAARLPAEVRQVVTSHYRNPSLLPQGGVLVVGASATGAQLAAEIHASGRPVTLAVSRHTRAPRTYRGRDLLWWYDAAGVGDEPASAVKDLAGARRSPSLQLVGTPDHRTLDLGVLSRMGVRLVGRALDAGEGRVVLGGDLAAQVADADRRLALLLARFDRHAEAAGLDVPPPDPIAPVPVAPTPAALDLAAEGIRTVVWATGYKRSYPWLHIPVLDAAGELVHDGGITSVPGLYVLGLPLLRRRKSAWLDGVGEDARELADHLLASRKRQAA